MSTDRVAVSVLEEFVKKVRLAAKSNQKTINIPIDDAVSVVFNLNLVLLSLLDKDQDAKTTTTEVVSVTMDGGGFDQTR
jgi:hypothetical protein